MHEPKRKYREELLHWIWENRCFEFQHLTTVCGKKITIHNPGRYNKSDGPDFRDAEISIGPLRWYGDVEIHWQLSHWKAHGHHNDDNYENVILHVVFQDTDKNIRRIDQSKIPTLCLHSHLSEPLHSFLDQYLKRPRLPCAGQVSFISEEAFSRQLEKAHQEYFEQKIDDLLEFFDSGLPPSMAWKKMFAIAIFDGLGISYNRLPMQKLANELFPKTARVSNAEELRRQAVALSGIRSGRRSSLNLNWKRKGCRPGNHPLPRIRQGADCLWYIHNTTLKCWMQEPPQSLWENMRNSIRSTPSMGQERSSILYGTVFLPALYSLGNLFYDKKLKNVSWQLWHDYQAALPQSLLEMLLDTDLPASVYAKKLGTIYQLRSYCRPRRCQQCEVFKSAISS
ncbi:MAG: DUF2851 family protein [Balneolaceae bacterium]